jgi:hypothetical protein
MASAQEPSLVRFYVKRPNGDMDHLYENRVEFLGPGGSADHVVASTATPDVLITVPARTDIPIARGDKLVITVELDASDGIDVSDCVWQIPFRSADGGVFILTDAKVTMSDITPAAATETILGTYEFEQGPYYFGGGKIFVSIEDDTA